VNTATYTVSYTLFQLLLSTDQIIVFDRGVPLFNAIVQDEPPPNSQLRNLVRNTFR